MAPKQSVEFISLPDSDNDQPAPSRRRKKSPDDSFDQQMAQAVAQSLFDSEEAFDQQMTRAIALSLAGSEASNGGASGSAEERETVAEPKGELREEMEKARLARKPARAQANGGQSSKSPTRKVVHAARTKISTISDLNAGACDPTSTLVARRALPCISEGDLEQIRLPPTSPPPLSKQEP